MSTFVTATIGSAAPLPEKCVDSIVIGRNMAIHDYFYI
jgi:hypothetical protein